MSSYRSAKTTIKIPAKYTEYVVDKLASNPAVMEQLERHTRRYIAPVAAKRVGQLYSEVFQSFSKLTGAGISGASRNYSGSVDTAYGPVQVGPWAALNSAWRKRKENGKKTKFWSNSGGTSDWASRLMAFWNGTNLSVANLDAAPGKAKASFRGLKVGSKGKTGRQIGVSYDILIPKTGNVYVDNIVSNLFVGSAAPAFSIKDGKKAGDRPYKLRGSYKEGRKTIRVSTLDKGAIVAVTDARRPLLSAISSALGLKVQQVIKEAR